MNRSLIEVAFQALAGNDPDRIFAVFSEEPSGCRPRGTPRSSRSS
ncbi:hypothetical protein [Streptomyces chrestomyceticus]